MPATTSRKPALLQAPAGVAPSRFPRIWPDAARTSEVPATASAEQAERAELAEPTITLTLSTDELATVWKLEWDAAAGGSEAEVRAALEVLAGGPLSA